MWITSSLSTALTPTVVALGNFDGIHEGHRRVIGPILKAVPSDSQSSQAVGDSVVSFNQLYLENCNFRDQENQFVFIEEASAISNVALDKMKEDASTYTTVVTFHPHPQEFFTGQPRKLLTPLNEKILQLRSLGIKQLVLLPFDRGLVDLSPQQFVEKILVQHLHTTRISIGEDFRFGRDRSGSALDLRAIAANFGIAVDIVSLQTSQGERISSSGIRQALQQGDLQRANRLLGDPYRLIGKVVSGQQLGRKLGFPTANLKLPSEKFLPCWGVYAVRVYLPHCRQTQKTVLGVMNIGCRPTVSNTEPTVEVHLLDWAGDLYGQNMIVSLERFLRPEQKFASIARLTAQIQADCALAREKLLTT